MGKLLGKNGFKIVAAVVLLAIVAVAVWMLTNSKKSNLPVLKKAADFTLEHTDGNQVSLSDGDGKVRLVYFFWSSCPDVCQPTTYELSKVQERLQEKGLLGSKALIYSISFDPERDTREKLKEYSARFNADPQGWKFLRGDFEKIKQLALQYGVGIIKNPDNTYAHTNSVALVDKNGNIRHYYTTTRSGPEGIDFKRIVRDVEQLAAEKSG